MLTGKGSRQKKKKCVKATAYPCKFTCISRQKRCRNQLEGSTKQLMSWLTIHHRSTSQDGKNYGDIDFLRASAKNSRDNLIGRSKVTDVKGEPLQNKTNYQSRQKLGSPFRGFVETPEMAISSGQSVAGEWVEHIKSIQGKIKEAQKRMRKAMVTKGGDRSIVEALSKAEKRLRGVVKLEAEAMINALIESSFISKKTAMSYVEKRINKPENITDEDRQAIADFIRLSNGQALVTFKKLEYISKTERAVASNKDGYVKVQQGRKATLWHELGHHVEYTSQNKKNKVGFQFIQQRATGEEAPLNDLKKRKIDEILKQNVQGGYAKDELAYPDHFISPYVGKAYANGEATEVISMGVQMLADPDRLLEFIEKDPDHLYLTIGIIKQKPITDNV